MLAPVRSTQPRSAPVGLTLGAPGTSLGTRQTMQTLADSVTQRDGASFNAAWKRLGDVLADHGVSAPRAPWVSWDDGPMHKAVNSAPSQPGFRPIAKSTLNAAKAYSAVAGEPNAGDHALRAMVDTVLGQGFPAPAPVHALATQLRDGRLTEAQRKDLGAQLRDAIARHF